MRVILLNLPVPDIYDRYQRGNHQLFADYVMAQSRIKGITDITFIKLERDVTDMLNNRGIVQRILSLAPDVVCFTSTLWNIDRNISIAHELKKSGIVTITGGAEINSDSYYHMTPEFDIMVNGEGEEIIFDILRDIKTHIACKYIVSTGQADLAALIPEYSLITTDYKYDGLAYLEIERGCPFQCSYCAYSKQKSKLSSLPVQSIKKSIANLINLNIDELYLLAPTLNRNKNRFDEILEIIINERIKNDRRIRLFGEIRPELLEDYEIQKMKLAGFDELEIGVQTLFPGVNEFTGRTGKEYDPIGLSKKLIDNGITPIIDFIVGLPGESKDDIIETIEKLDKASLLEYSSFYHLQVLPVTSIRNEFIKKGLKFQSEPPYLALDSGSIKMEEIQEVYRYLEENKKHSYFEPINIIDEERFYNIDDPNREVMLVKNDFYQTGSFFTYDPDKIDYYIYLYNKFFDDNPEVFHVVYVNIKETNTSFIGKLKQLRDICSKHENYYDRYRESINYFKEPFSKQLEILISPGVSGDFINFLIGEGFNIAFYAEDFSFIHANLEILSFYYDSFDIPVYLFESELLPDENYGFITVLPCKVKA